MYVTPAVVGDLVYVSSCSGLVFAFEEATGVVRWSYNTKLEDGAQATFHGEPVVTDDLLIVPGDTGWVYAFELQSGRVRWKTLAGPMGVFGDLARAGSLLAGSSTRGGAFALELETGVIRWQIEPAHPYAGMHFSSLARIGDRLYVADLGSRISSVVLETGETLWTRDLESPLTTDIAALDGRLVVGLSDRRMLALDAATGDTNAAIELPLEVLGTPVLAGDAWIVTDNSSFLHAVAGDLSAVRWSQAGRWSSDRVLVEGDVVVAGTAQGELTALRLDTGEPIWSAAVDGVIRGIGRSNARYFVGVQAGTLYAYERE